MINFKKTLSLINNSNAKFDICNSYTTKTLKNNLVKFNSQDMSKSDNVDVNLFDPALNFSKESAIYTSAWWHKRFDDDDEILTVGGHGSVGNVIDGKFGLNENKFIKISINKFILQRRTIYEGKCIR